MKYINSKLFSVLKHFYVMGIFLNFLNGNFISGKNFLNAIHDIGNNIFLNICHL